MTKYSLDKQIRIKRIVYLYTFLSNGMQVLNLGRKSLCLDISPPLEVPVDIFLQHKT